MGDFTGGNAVMTLQGGGSQLYLDPSASKTLRRKEYFRVVTGNKIKLIDSYPATVVQKI